MTNLRAAVRNAARWLLNRVAARYLHQRRIRMASAHEPEILLITSLVAPATLAVDVGANQGMYVDSLLAAGASVVAYEPHPRMAAYLRKFYGGRVTLHAVALSDRQGTAALRLPKGNASWATLAATNKLELADTQSGLEQVEVEVRTLDSYRLDGVSFIKIDVEGHEEGVLSGAKQTITSNRPCLLIEIEERHNPGAVGRVVEFLREHQYDAFYLEDKRLHGIVGFTIETHQPRANVGVSGKTGRYINNFIFVPVERTSAAIQHARSLGITAASETGTALR